MAVGKYDAAFTTVVMFGWVGLVTRKGVVAGACDGLFGGAGFVTARVQAIGYIAPAGTARYAALIVACSTLRLNNVELSVIEGLAPSCIVTTEVLKKLSP